MSNFKFARLPGLVLACFLVPCSGVSAIIHTESAIFTENILGGQARVDLEIDDLGATRIWRYTVTNLSFAPEYPFGYQADIGVFYLGRFDPFFPLIEPGLADDFTAPAGWLFSKEYYSAEWLWFFTFADGLDIGEQGLFTFSEVKYVTGVRVLPNFSTENLGPHEITQAGWVVLGDLYPIGPEPYIGFTLEGSISLPGPRAVAAPEPSPLLLSIFGLAALAAVRRRRRRR